MFPKCLIRRAFPQETKVTQSRSRSGTGIYNVTREFSAATAYGIFDCTLACGVAQLVLIVH